VAEHRQHPRKSLHSTLAFRIGEGPRVDALCRDVSLGGIFIETASPPPYGTKIAVFMLLPGLKEPVTVEATVRWAKPDGMGVQFGVMGARETHALTQLLTTSTG
jgi:type IV pilus assembly protein PilZ